MTCPRCEAEETIRQERTGISHDIIWRCTNCGTIFDEDEIRYYLANPVHPKDYDVDETNWQEFEEGYRPDND